MKQIFHFLSIYGPALFHLQLKFSASLQHFCYMMPSKPLSALGQFFKLKGTSLGWRCSLTPDVCPALQHLTDLVRGMLRSLFMQNRTPTCFHLSKSYSFPWETILPPASVIHRLLKTQLLDHKTQKFHLIKKQFEVIIFILQATLLDLLCDWNYRLLLLLKIKYFFLISSWEETCWGLSVCDS